MIQKDHYGGGWIDYKTMGYPGIKGGGDMQWAVVSWRRS